MNSGKVVLSVLAGVAAGAVLGILFAPDKGSETRRKIGKKKDELTDELKDKFNEIVDTVSDKYERIKGDLMTNSDHKSKSVTVENK